MGDTPTKEELRVGLDAAIAVAMSITKNRPHADDFVQRAFEAVLDGTRPWSRSRMPFERHLAGAVASIINHTFESKAPAREQHAARGHYREEAGKAKPSPQEAILDHAEETQKQDAAEKELDALAASVAENATARDVLRCRREHELTKASDIAQKLGLPVEQVYRANEVLRDHLRKLRKRRPPGEEE